MPAEELVHEGMDRIENLLAPDDAKVFAVWRNMQEQRLKKQYALGREDGRHRAKQEVVATWVGFVILGVMLLVGGIIGGAMAYNQAVGELECSAPVAPEQHSAWKSNDKFKSYESLHINNRTTCFRTPKAPAFSCIITE